ncbi:rhodanese-like domain-containing protein [Sulfuriroseicoccus oceanibius]|uniref:Rhodanese-like domain-containing protein n=2 Tax=Sulfuriroseicoccus oceanibius TaxID=2707525 RepID=A0A6B3LCY9_9BACT|nr:rhodanese-like domain-containing protein [Sulfuriroseicoccus oceanibius]
MTEVLSAFPGAQRALFAAFHIGGCQACGFQPGETLAQVCDRNEDVTLDEAIKTIVENHQSDVSLSISPQELQTALAGDDAPSLVDIRTHEEFDAVKIEGALFFSENLQQEIFGTWPKESPIVVYDHTGNRALDAAAYFIGHGFSNTRALTGGIDAWAKEVDKNIPRYKLEFDA